MLSISTGDRNRTCELLVQSQTQRPTVATPEYFKQAVGCSDLDCRFSIQPVFLQTSNLQPTACSRVPCRSRTDLTGLEVQDLCRSANGTLKKAPAAGIEPASGRLTVAFPYQHRTHRSIYNLFMNTSDQIDGTVVDATDRVVTVEADDGTKMTALVPRQWFSARGRFDMCASLPVGIRVRVRLLSPSKQHRVIDVID